MGNSIPPTSLTWVIREVKPRVKLQPGRILFFIQKRIFKSANIRPERQKKGPQPTKRFFSSSNSTRFTQFVPLSFLCSVFLDCWDCFCFRGSLFSPLDFPQCQCDPFPHWLALHWVKIPAGTPINYWCISGLCSMFCCCFYWCSTLFWCGFYIFSNRYGRWHKDKSDQTSRNRWFSVSEGK